MLTDSNRIGVAVVGAGYWGPNLIRNFSSSVDCQLCWVCDRKPGRLQFIHERFPDVPLTEDYGAVLADPMVEAVAIATPVSTHRNLALAALEAGKHVFIEKPLAATSAEAEEIVRVGRQAGRIVAVGHIFVYNPAVAKMKEMILANEIGELCYAESSRVNLGPPASEVNVIWDLAVHDVAILMYLWDRQPVEVTAHGGQYIHPRLLDVAFLHIRFSDGSMAVHHVSWLSPEKVRRFFVGGTQGSLKFDDLLSEGKLRHVDLGVDTRIGAKDEDAKELYYKPGRVTIPTWPEVEPLRAECQHFLDCIRSGDQLRADGQSGLDVVRVLEAANLSILSGSAPIALSVPVGL